MAKGMTAHGGASVTVDTREALEALARSKFKAQGVYYAAASQAQLEAVKWLKASTNTWEHKPHFTVTTTPPMVQPVYGGIEGIVVGMDFSTTIEITTDSDVFKFVDKGTRPHAIFLAQLIPLPHLAPDRGCGFCG
jgi:hypothetical protein